jgi:hypothetical protein
MQAKDLVKKHQQLTHSENKKVTSHIQREQDDWFINTLMIAGVDVPFKYKRKQRYRTLTGQQVNLTYYPHQENVAGFTIEVMNVVRIKLV